MPQKPSDPKSTLDAIIDDIRSYGEVVRDVPDYESLSNFHAITEAACNFALRHHSERDFTTQQIQEFLGQLQDCVHTQLTAWIACNTIRHRDMVVHTFEYLHGLEARIEEKWPQLTVRQSHGDEPPKTFQSAIVDIYEQMATQCLAVNDLGTFSDLRARCRSKPYLNNLLSLVIEKAGKYTVNISDDNSRRVEVLFNLTSQEITITSDYTTRGQRLSSMQEPYERAPLIPLSEFITALEKARSTDVFARKKNPVDKNAVKSLAAMTLRVMDIVASMKDPIAPDEAIVMAARARDQFKVRLEKFERW